MKNQTLSIEQMKRLQDLGVDVSKASMVYHTYKDITDEWVERDDITSSHFKIDENSEPITSLDIRSGDERLYHDMNDCSNYSCCEFILAFTLQDMLEMIPVYVLVDNVEYWMELYLDTNCITETERNYHMRYKDINSKSVAKVVGATSVLESAYLMLCWLAENGHLKGGKP